MRTARLELRPRQERCAGYMSYVVNVPGKPSRRPAGVFMGAALCIGLWTAVSTLVLLTSGSWYRTTLLIGITSVLVLPLYVRSMMGRFDCFEPIVWATAALGGMFVVRPLLDLIAGRSFHLGIDISTKFDSALLAALIGIVAFQCGYASGLGRFLASKIGRIPARFNIRSTALAAGLTSVTALFLFGVFIAANGGLGTLESISSGRTTAEDTLFRSNTGYLYNSLDTLMAAGTLFFALGVASKRRILLAIAVVVLLVPGALHFLRGDRSAMLPFLAIPIFWYLYHQRRPSVLKCIAATLILFTVLGFFRDIRNGDTRTDNLWRATENAIANPFSAALRVADGADDEMFDALTATMVVVPNLLPYRPGGTLLDIPVRALPRVLFPNKPMEVNDAVTSAIWPERYRYTRGMPALSILGPFYADSWYIGIGIGMFGIGTLCAAIWHWYRMNSNKLFAIIIYSALLPFVVHLLRGTIPDTLAHLFFAAFPIIVIHLLITWPNRHAHQRVCRLTAQAF